MAVRVTQAEVGAVIEIDSSITTPFTTFISTANTIVNQVCTDSSLTEAQLKLIETWLAAHCYAIRDNRRSSEKADVVSENFQYKLGLNLKCTMHGQMAIMMDTSGALERYDKGGRRNASFVSIDLT